MKKEILYIWLQLALGFSNRLARELLIKFTGIEELYNCEDFSFLGKEREKYVRRLESKDTSEAFEVLKRCTTRGIKITGYYEPGFPSSLKLIEAPPVALYSIGVWRDLDLIPRIAVVGTRKMSDYGREVAEKFAYVFAKSGACVISGLAKGVDTAAHRGAIMAGGYTVAVLGNPVDEIYPPENKKAFETLYSRGLVISEMFPKAPRTRADFPNRNRLISGLADATVIAEAGEHSGALITAKYAVSQGRALYAVPGAVGAENAGTNRLIKSGVAVATDPYDVIAPLALEYPEKIKPYEPALTEGLRSYGNSLGKARPAREEDKPPVYFPPSESASTSGAPVAPMAGQSISGSGGERIIAVLKNAERALTADEISRAAGMSASETLSELTMLEIEGAVVSSAGNRYSVSKL